MSLKQQNFGLGMDRNKYHIKTSIIDGLSSYVMRARDELDDCVNSIFEETLSIYQNRKEDLEG